MICPKCNRDVLEGSRFCSNCGAELHSVAPKIKRWDLQTKILVSTGIVFVMAFVAMGIFQKSSGSNGTSRSVSLSYDLSTEKLRDAEKKMRFTEASWWYGRQSTGEDAKQYVNVHVVTQGSSKRELGELVTFYGARFAGAEILRINFWSHPARIAINGAAYSGAPRRPSDLTSTYPDPIGTYSRKSNGEESWVFIPSESEKQRLESLLESIK